MYIYLTNDIGVFTENIVGVFDMDNTTQGSRITAEFLRCAKTLDATGGDIPRSFILTHSGEIILSSLNSKTVMRHEI